jgi:hypothetical protein
MSDELNMSRVCVQWVSRLLKDDEKEHPVAASTEFLKPVTADNS